MKTMNAAGHAHAAPKSVEGGPRSRRAKAKRRRVTLHALAAPKRSDGGSRFAPLSILYLSATLAHAQDLGIFESHQDIGNPSKPGAVAFQSANRSYVVAGGGANMWLTNDAFQFVWTRVSGDFSLQAAIDWLAPGGDLHRKACLMVRQTLGPDSPYVDAAVHGNGLISLQYREAPGGPTHEIQARQPTSPVGASPGSPSGPRLPATRAAIERQGEVFFLSLESPPEAGHASGPRPPIAPTLQHSNTPLPHTPSVRPAGSFIRLKLSDPLYVGLAVCSHNDNVIEQARFSDVELRHTESRSDLKPVLHCSLETVPIASGDRRVIYHTLDHIEAPNWSRDGRSFLFNSANHIYRLPAVGGEPGPIDTGFADHCNNDHGLSPDGLLLAISDQSRGGKSLIYVLPIAGGTPRQLTTLGPSYWHGWSPDGLTLAYCAQRDGEFDIYTIPAQGGQETRLTTAKGLDDGPDYSPDGKFIYFNSERTGTMQIWRMKPDGHDQEQVTFDDFNNWFPHPSPDGKWLVFLSYGKDVTGHPANQPVRLRLMAMAGGPIRELARLFGGQGTINVPSWSPDSRQLAFVSYELIR